MAFATAMTSVARRSINCKRSGHGIGRVVPAAVEAHSVVAAACRNAAVIAEIVDGHVGAALGLAAIPELRNSLSIGERPSQSPIRDVSRSRIVDGDGRTKSAGPLVGYGVADVT